ncbi:MAG: hypothetical protein HYV90_05120 [Candidatus Woesebacteria bacterium]|nr:MAG: hypothetical protein HYV90_05120 [Candidatus Woesebacteria bacterium]
MTYPLYLRTLAWMMGDDDLVKIIDGEPADLPNLTGQELARALGLKADKPEDIDWTEFANACLNAQFNPLVIALPEKQRLQVLRTAADLLSHIW